MGAVAAHKFGISSGRELVITAGMVIALIAIGAIGVGWQIIRGYQEYHRRNWFGVLIALTIVVVTSLSVGLALVGFNIAFQEVIRVY